jgi:predicted Zn-dependent protease
LSTHPSVSRCFNPRTLTYQYLDHPDARTSPGGRIFVNTQKLSNLKTPGQLAALLSHEMAHAIAHHRAEWDSYQALLSSLRLLPGYHKGLIEYGIHITDSKIRLDELECATMGLHIMATAGFNPQEAIELFFEELKL